MTLGSRGDDAGAASGAPAVFSTLPPGATLPSGAECASRVVRSAFEPRPDNAAANHATPGESALRAFHAESWTAVDPAVPGAIRARIDGDFTGTTDEIIQWTACKWGFEDELLRAAAVVWSDWRQSSVGRVEPGTCPPGVPPDADGNCAHTYGLFAVNYDAEASAHSTWPMLRDSTAFNADYMGGFLRMCFEGYVTWLDDVAAENGAPYVPGDASGCVGFAEAGRWENAAATDFTGRVRTAHEAKPWRGSAF